MKIHPVGTELFHEDGQRQTDMTKPIVAFRNIANASRSWSWFLEWMMVWACASVQRSSLSSDFGRGSTKGLTQQPTALAALLTQGTSYIHKSISLHLFLSLSTSVWSSLSFSKPTERNSALLSKSVILRVALAYLLTPYGAVLLEKLTGPQLVRKFPEFYGTWRFMHLQIPITFPYP